MQYTIKLKRDIFPPVMCSPHLPLLLNSPLGICSFAPTPHVKIKKNYFKRQPFFFPSGKAVRVFHIIVLTISRGKGGPQIVKTGAEQRSPKERFPQRKTITIGTPVARRTATSSWLRVLSFRCPPRGDGVSSAASPSRPRLISCSPRHCRRG